MKKDNLLDFINTMCIVISLVAIIGGGIAFVLSGVFIFGYGVEAILICLMGVITLNIILIQLKS